MADASKRRVKSVPLSNSADVICSIDIDGKFVAVSPASMTMFGFSPDELMGAFHRFEYS